MLAAVSTSFFIIQGLPSLRHSITTYSQPTHQLIYCCFCHLCTQAFSKVGRLYYIKLARFVYLKGNREIKYKKVLCDLVKT